MGTLVNGLFCYRTFVKFRNVTFGGTMSKTVTVNIQGRNFVPQRVDVAIGDTVEWTNEDPYPHSVVSDKVVGGKPLFESPARLDPHKTFSHTFDGQSGVVGYHCGIHLTMKGTVVVA